MEINIVDFIPKYPNINKYEQDYLNPYDTNFYTSIYKKKEFYDEKLDVIENVPEKRGEYFKHQNIIARFFSSYTLYDQLLLFHEMGTGKTCTSIRAIETIRYENSRFTGAMIFASGEGLLNNYVNELIYKCTSGEYIPVYKTEAEKIHRINKIVKKYYSLNTFETFAKKIQNMKDQEIIKYFSNKIIVIDEVHNIRVQDNISDSSIHIYDQFWRFLHTVKNCKILLMSGTPMKDSPVEISSIMNLILPINEQLPEKKKFINDFFIDEGEDLLIIKQERISELKSKFKGRVSYLKSMQSTVTKRFMENNYSSVLEHFKIYEDYMSIHQTKYYIDAWKKDSIQKGIYINSRQSILFTFEDGTYGEEFFDKWIIKIPQTGIKKNKQKQYRLKNELKQYFTLYDDNKSKLEQLFKYSNKFAITIENIFEAIRSNKSSFVYCEFVKGSGCILFSLILELFGFSKATGMEEEGNEALRYALVTAETTSTRNIKRLIERFNRQDNMNGKIINVIIGSRVISEGYSLKNVQEEHILTPHWNYSEIAQSIARGWRVGSHNDLLKSNLNNIELKVYQYVSLLNNSIGNDGGIDSIDMKMYKVSENKDISIKKIERIIKETAFDCSLNYNRNFITGYDGQRECEYENCYYICENIDSTLLSTKIEENELDYSTSQLYYNNINNYVIERVKKLLIKNFHIDLNNIINDPELKNTRLFEILTTISNMINNNITIINKYGFPCYIRENNNKLFLVDEITSNSEYLLGYYNKNPSVSSIPIFKDEMYNLTENFEFKILKYCDNTMFKENIPKLSLETQEFILESSLLAVARNIYSELRDFTLDFFQNKYFEINGVYISILLKDKLRCLENGIWVDCSDNSKKILRRKIKLDIQRLKKSKHGYGVINGTQFKIIRTENINDADKRKQSRGRDCKTWNKNDLVQFIINLNIPINKKYIVENNEQEYIKYWETKRTEDLCKAIKKWYKSNNLLLEEKIFKLYSLLREDTGP